ncbi:MAG: DUF5689 domain-containing protein [Saprospiraceae bacterium]|nr:DUF5689 domain-containing protein [Saprospiraceae bacterium]
MKFFKNFNLFLAIALLATTFTACVDLEFDEPSLDGLADIAANTTIAELKALHTIGNDAVLVEDDLIIRGVVIADDLSGNFFKNLTIEDETGGIQIRLNLVGLSDVYPQGSEVFVRCQGLFVGDFAELPQISGTVEGDAIEEVLVEDFVIPGKTGQEVTPEVITIDQLDDPTFLSSKLNTLVQLNDVEFAPEAAGGTYAGVISTNLNIQDCNTRTIILRTSSFSDFASELTPTGNGSLTAVLGRFRDDIQLTIRDTDDIQFAAERCDGSVVGGDLEQMDIIELRELFATGGTEGPSGKKIKGVIVSDDDAANIVGQNLMVQDATGGIVVRFTDFHNLPLGTEIEVNVSGQELSEFSGLLQVNNVPLLNVTNLGTGVLPTPREATIAEITANAEQWESTVVKVMDATITGGSNFAGPRTVTDATGTIPMFTRNGASFAEDALPSGSVELVALVGDFNGVQLNMRNGDDVTGGGSTGGGDPVQMDIMELRDLFEGGSSVAPNERKIRGIVISDINNGNLTGRNLVIQDGSGGIVVRFEDVHSFALGEELEVVVSGEELSEFNGLLQVNNVPNESALSFGNGTLPDPRVATVQEVIDNLEDWESTLVVISGVSISGADGVYNGLTTITDASGSIGMFTRGDASFSSTALPSDEVTLTAIVSQFNDPQIVIRNLNDIN